MTVPTVAGPEQPRLAPSEVRARVLAEHGQIRQMLDELERLIMRELAAPGSHAGELRARVVELGERLQLHLRLEEDELLPILATIDAWGPARVERIQAEHSAQRLEIRAIVAQARDVKRSTIVLGRVVSVFIDLLREDMRQEEADVLSAELLRDDIFMIDYFGG